MANSGTPNFGSDTTKEYYKFLLIKYSRNWFWFVLSVCLAMGIAYFYLSITNPIYNVNAHILIKDDRLGGSSKDDFLKELDLFTPQKIVENEIEILKSQTLIKTVVSDLGLNISYATRENFIEKDIYKECPIKVTLLQANKLTYAGPFIITITNNNTFELDDKPYPLNKPVITPIGTIRVILNNKKTDNLLVAVTISPLQTTSRSYLSRLRIAMAVRPSSVLIINFEDTVPERGIDFVNRLIYFYDLASLKDKNKVASNTLAFVEKRLDLISKELTEVEKAIQNYKTTTGIIDISNEASLFLDKFKENDAKLSGVALQIGVLSELEKYVKNKTLGSGFVPSTIGLEEPILINLIQQASELELQRERVIKTVPETSPAVQAIDNQLDRIKLNIADNILSIKKVLNNTQQQLLAVNRQLETSLRSIPQKERTLLDISRQQGIKSNIYTYLLQKREETALSFASAVSDMRVIDPANSDFAAIRPIRSSVYLFSGLVGLIIPIILLWLFDFLNNKVSRKSQVEEMTQIPVIGEIIQAAIKTPLEVSPSSRSMLSEQIRALRTNIRFFNLNTQSDTQTILITSSISGEGKSFISLNLGASFAITDKKVLLMELDLRKPKIHKYLNVKNQQGLSTYLVGNASLDDVITQVPNYPNFFFIPCGPIPPNPAELLSSVQMNKLVGELKDRFEVVLMDTPPIGLVTDAQIMAPYADITVYVVRHLYTQKAFLKNVNNLYKEKKFNNMSILINGIVLKKEYEYNYGYGYDYGYGYAYKYGYHTDEGQTKTGNGWLKKLRGLFSRSA